MPFAPDQMSINTVKGFVDRLMRSQKNTPAPAQWPPKRAQAQETVAHVLGFASWHALQQTLSEQEKAAPGTRAQIEEAPILILPGRVHCTAPCQYAHDDRFPITKIRWNDQVGNMVVVGSAQARHNAFCDFARDNAGVSPVLWIRSNLAAHYSQSTPGFGLVGGKPGDLCGVINQTLKSGSAEECEQMLMGLLEEDNSMWRGRAQDLLSRVLQALVHTRDVQGWKLDATRLMWHLQFLFLEELAQNPSVPKANRESLQAYLNSLPLYKKGAQRQADQTLDMHGYLQMRFSKILDMSRDASPPLSTEPRQILWVDEISEGPQIREGERWGLIGAFIDLWLRNNPNARLLFDGFLPSSAMFRVLQNNLVRWNGAGALVLVAGQDGSLIPLDWSTRVNMDRPGKA